ncbi:hypothetical protein [Candidatus Sulfurimonas baltica]|nr:hypothetical protein [Candidatus Sulfurimonas baltica]
MVADAKKEEDYIILNEKGTSPFFCAKAAMATKVKFLQNFIEFF